MGGPWEGDGGATAVGDPCLLGERFVEERAGLRVVGADFRDLSEVRERCGSCLEVADLKGRSLSLAVSGGDVWLISTPFGRRGFFYRAWMEGGPGWQRVKVPATECPRIRPENLARDRIAMGDRWFRQEYPCEFAANEETLFPEELVRKAIKYDIQPLFPHI